MLLQDGLQRRRLLLGRRKKDHLISLFEQIAHLVEQQGQVVAKPGGVALRHREQPLWGKLVAAVRQRLQKDGLKAAQRAPELAWRLCKGGEFAGELLLLQRALDLLFQQSLGFGQPFGAGSLLADQHRGVRQIVEQRGGRLPEQGHQAVFNLSALGQPLHLFVTQRRHHLCRLAPPGFGGLPRLFKPLPEPLQPALRQKLGGGRHKRLGQPLQAALRQGVKGVQRVDLVAEEFDAHGLGRARCEDVDNAAPCRELARALHQIASHIAGLHQPFKQISRRDLLSTGECDAVLRQQIGRQRKLRERVGRGQHNARLFKREQRRDPLVHEFTRGPLHTVERQIDGGIPDALQREPLQLLFHVAAFRFIGAQKQDFPIFGN